MAAALWHAPGAEALPADAHAVLPHEVALVAVVVVGALAVVRATSRLAAIAAIGVVGYAQGLLFVAFAAPDLAMTQFAIETLSVILFVLVLARLPPDQPSPARRRPVADVLVAGTVGALMAAVTLAVASTTHDVPVKQFFAEASVPLGQGRNVVNVTLVDFRALDTLGEITVLAVAALGVWALVRLRPAGRTRS
jgi:multicomponent Na+:H+ antiporter subunit A